MRYNLRWLYASKKKAQIIFCNHNDFYFFDDFYEFIDEIAKGLDLKFDKRRRLINEMVKYTDGNNCQRIIDTLNI